MQRKALLLYLRELRDLEFANWKLMRLYENELKEFKKKYKELTQTSYMNVPPKFDGWTGDRKFSFISCLCLSLLILIMFIGMLATGEKAVLDPTFQGIFLFGMLMFGGIAVWTYIKVDTERRENEEKIAAAEVYNDGVYVKHIANQDKAEQLKLDWKKRSFYLEKEKEKAKKLLRANYDLNIIPSQYRNIASIYYIYDYMSTSNASFEDTLIHEHMENGIQRIVEKLDHIINQNYQIIMQNRRIEAANQQILQANKKMLKQLENIEEQAYIATQYAELSANYSEATAYFSLANYLK